MWPLLLLACLGTGPYARDDDDDGASELEGDCDDGDPEIGPHAVERCNDLDDDCDGLTDDKDEDVTSTSEWHPDHDGDGYGDVYTTDRSCAAPEGWLADGSDCDDLDPSFVGLPWFRDADGDGFGDPTTAVLACSAPPGHVDRPGDCDDRFAEVYPGALDPLDAVDHDCDGYTNRLDVRAPDALVEGGPSGVGLGAIVAAVGDLDADGFDEVLFGVPSETALPGAYLFRGPLEGERSLSDASAVLTSDTVGLVTGLQVGGGVDLVGDGHGDLVVTGSDPRGSCHVWAVPGPLAGDATLEAAAEAHVSLPRTSGGECGPRPVLLADADGDGLGDLAVARPYFDRVQRFSGPLDGEIGLEEATLAITTPTRALLGGSVLSAGDVDGDGLEDLALGAPGAEAFVGLGAVAIVLGGRRGEIAFEDADVLVSPEGVAGIGHGVVKVGDLDGDGRDDLSIAADPRVYLLLAPHDPQPTLADADAVVGDLRAGSRIQVAGPGDLDGDGWDDLVVGEPCTTCAGGRAWLLTGPFSGAHTLDPSVDPHVVSHQNLQTFGYAAPAGDLDGDARPDLLLGATQGPFGGGQVYLLGAATLFP